MSDIFISYAAEDRPWAKVLAGALKSQGWSVWWDRTIPFGKRYHQVIEEELAEQAGADLFVAPPRGERPSLLTPLDRAELAPRRDRPDLEDCRGAGLGRQRLPVARLPVGSHLCVRTNEGRLARLEILEPFGRVGALVVECVTWDER